MTFETEYQLMCFRELQPEYWDELTGRRYSTPIGDSFADQMLKLINQMEKEIHDLEYEIKQLNKKDHE